MKVLVTGAGGFLGYGIATRLVEQGHDVQGFSRNPHDHLRDLGVTQHTGDLADAAAVAKATEGCQLVYHVAARPGAWGPYKSFYDTNVRGTQSVLDACRMHEVANLVYTSTPSVVSRGIDLEGVDETAPIPSSFKAHYPATKAIAEKLVRGANTDRLRTVSLRPHLVWGPRDPNLLPRLVARAQAGQLRQIGAEKLIDTTYIDDAVRAHLLAAARLQSDEHQRVAGKVYFVSSGHPVGTWTMINRMLGAAGQPPIEKTIAPRTAYAAGCVFELLYGLLRIQAEPPTTRWVVDELSTAHWYDIRAANQDLGYTPEISLDEGMARLSAWWRSRGASHDG